MPYFYYTEGMATLIFSILLMLVAVVGGIILHFTFLSPKNAGRFHGFLGWVYDFLSFKKLMIEGIVRFFYVVSTCILVAYSIITLFSSGSVGAGLLGFVVLLFVGNLALRIVYELLLLSVLICKNLMQINQKLSKKDGQEPGYRAPVFQDDLVPEKVKNSMKNKMQGFVTPPQPAAGQAPQGQPVMQGQPFAPGQQPMAGQPFVPGQQPMAGQPFVPGQQPMAGQPFAPGQQPMAGQPLTPGQQPMPEQSFAPGQEPVPGQAPQGQPAMPGQPPQGQPAMPGQPPKEQPPVTTQEPQPEAKETPDAPKPEEKKTEEPKPQVKTTSRPIFCLQCGRKFEDQEDVCPVCGQKR